MRGEQFPMKEQTKPTMGDFVRSGSCTGDPQMNALNCIRTRNLTIFTDIINDCDPEAKNTFPLPDDHWMNQPLEEEDDKTLLMLALELELAEFVKVLLRAGAKASQGSLELGRSPIHGAAQTGNVEMLSLLFWHQKNQADVNSIVTSNGRTALHISVENIQEDCVRFLLRLPGIDVNVRDKKRGQTPLYLAIKSGSRAIAQMLIENGANLDTVCFGKSLKQHLTEKMPNLDLSAINGKKAPMVKQVSCDTVASILMLIEKNSIHYDMTSAVEFRSLISQLSPKELQAISVSGNTLLQKIAKEELPEFADILLEDDQVSPDATPFNEKMPPLLIAAKLGNAELMRILLLHKADVKIITPESRENILHAILKNGAENDQSKYQRCLQILWDFPEKHQMLTWMVNMRDVLGNTALHYATQYWDQNTVRKLLELGANIGMKNHWEDIPITSIPPQTMEEFLDEYCIKSAGDVNHEGFEITFDYSFLAPPKEDLPFLNRGISIEPESQKLSEDEIGYKVPLPETQSLWHMSQSKEHRYLLKHPVVTSFLYLKWGRIRRDFNKNLRFYLLFVYILTWYIFETFGHLSRTEPGSLGFWHGLFVVLAVILLCFIIRDWIMDLQEAKNNYGLQKVSSKKTKSKTVTKVVLRNWIEVAYISLLGYILIGGAHANTLWISLLTLSIILIIRECFQVAVSLRRYLLSPENWIEVSVLIIIGVILFAKEHEETKRHLSAVAIVLSWAELITLVGKHPKLTTYNVYVTMFYKVMGTFIFFLCWYAFFIVAFGLGFYIMLHNTPNQEVTEEDYIFFNSPWLALVKTSTMFVGELEFSDIPINLQSPLAGLDYVFFLSFVFLIVVVLMNLLNGLAVSDTGVIQEKAEIVSYVSRVDTISYTESILLGDPFNFLSNWPALKWLSQIPSFSCLSQVYRHHGLQKLFHNLTGATDILLFYNILPSKKLTLNPNEKKMSCQVLKGDVIDPDILKSAKEIVLKNMAKSDENKMEQRMEKVEEKLEEILNILKALPK